MTTLFLSVSRVCTLVYGRPWLAGGLPRGRRMQRGGGAGSAGGHSWCDAAQHASWAGVCCRCVFVAGTRSDNKALCLVPPAAVPFFPTLAGNKAHEQKNGQSQICTKKEPPEPAC